MLDPVTALAFTIFENKGVYALLIGSGLSTAAQIPTGWQITVDLIRRVGLLEGVKEQTDWVAWYRRKFKKEPEHSDLLNVLGPTPDERRAILHRYIEATPEDVEENRKMPTRAHRAIAQLVKDDFIRVIITTNFDRLLENAFREVGIEPTVIKSEDDLAGAIPLAHSRCYVVKLHGDYLDTRIRSTEGELKSYPESFDRLLDRIFDEYGLIVSGWSGEWDSALKRAIIRAPNRRYQFFWTTRGAPKTTAQDITANRAGRFIPIANADDFWVDLAAKVAIQVDLQPADPRSVRLLTATTKKYLSDSRHRIELNDLFMHELKRTLELVAAENVAMYRGVDQAADRGEFVRQVAWYEAIFEPLAKMFAVLGRWGSDTEFKLVTEILASLLNQEMVGGDVIFMALRVYPAVLLAYAYGLGSLRAGQLRRVNSLFRMPVRTWNGSQSTFVKDYFLDAWEIKSNVWSYLPEYKGKSRMAALSGHLHEILRPWLSSDIFLPKEFTLNFEEFELLGSLAFLSVSQDEETLHTVMADQTGQKWAWTRLGRIVWNTEVITGPIMAKWNTEEMRRALVDVGFAPNANFLKLAIGCVKKRLALARSH